MKALFLIPIILVIFAVGYYIMAKVDLFVVENHRKSAKLRSERIRIRIAAENSLLLSSVKGALENCVRDEPHISVALRKGKPDRLVEKLMAEQVDILLLTEEYAEELEWQCADLRIPYEKTVSRFGIHNKSAVDQGEDTRIRVIWKKTMQSKDRDRVIFALENEHRRLKTGYADYLE